MQIMIVSGDTLLSRTAIEFGLVSADPKLQCIPVEAILETGVPLIVAIDGSGLEDLTEFNFAVYGYHDVAGTPDGTAYSVPIGTFDQEKGCYVQPSRVSDCAASVWDTAQTAQTAF